MKQRAQVLADTARLVAYWLKVQRHGNGFTESLLRQSSRGDRVDPGGPVPSRKMQIERGQRYVHFEVLGPRPATRVNPSNVRFFTARQAATGVRRDKAALSSGCEPHPANAPAGSNRSSYGGNEMAEAFG